MTLFNQRKMIMQITQKALVKPVTPATHKFIADNAANENLKQICHKAMLGILVSLGIQEQGKGCNNLFQLSDRLLIQKKYRYLFAEVVEELMLTGAIHYTSGGYHIVPGNLNEATGLLQTSTNLTKHASLFKDHLNHVQLLIPCLQNFKDILLGNIRATDILFPQGSFDRVSGIYVGNRQADYFNSLLADIVKDSVDQGLTNCGSREKIRIL
ncbi:MAG TPA: hypothetical protein VLB84_03375, partial [Bacteroidia bacterium]|nr:hypothetical protein [Bacteroidia bacterium]